VQEETQAIHSAVCSEESARDTVSIVPQPAEEVVVAEAAAEEG
jgi:hypothetical protein